jgi:hypothetical protein
VTDGQPTLLWVGTAGGVLAQLELGVPTPVGAWKVADGRIQALAAVTVNGGGAIAAAVGSDVHVFAAESAAAVAAVRGVAVKHIVAMAGLTVDGRGLLVILAADGSVRTVDPSAGVVVGADPWLAPAPVTHMTVFDRDSGGMIVTGDAVGGVALYHPATGTEIRRAVVPGGRVHALAATTCITGPGVWTSMADGGLRGLDATTLAPVAGPVAAHPWLMAPVAIDDDLVITNGADGLCGWDRHTGEQRAAYAGSSRVWSMVTVTLPDGRRVLASSSGMDSAKPVRRWDASTGESLPPLADSTDEVMALAVITGDGRPPWIAGARRDGVIRRWDADTGQIIGDDLHGTTPWMPAGLGTYVHDGTVVLVWTGEAVAVRQWKARTGVPTGPEIDVDLDIDDMIVVADRDEPFVAVIGWGDPTTTPMFARSTSSAGTCSPARTSPHRSSSGTTTTPTSRVPAPSTAPS